MDEGALVPSSWCCNGYGCPRRAPVASVSTPKCYTCGKPMDEVPIWQIAVDDRVRELAKQIDKLRSTIPPIMIPIPPTKPREFSDRGPVDPSTYFKCDPEVTDGAAKGRYLDIIAATTAGLTRWTDEDDQAFRARIMSRFHEISTSV